MHLTRRRLVELFCLIPVAWGVTAGGGVPAIPPTQPSPDPGASNVAWPALSRENKPWTRWWWLGSAVDKPNLTRELEQLRDAGFGGVEITPIYGFKGVQDRYIPFLSETYVQMLAHVCSEAKRLGLGVDMATGTGWPFGGPNVTPQDAELQVAFTGAKLLVKPSGFSVKRAAPGGGGLVLDPYSPAAMNRYLQRFTDALAPLPTGSLRSQFHDSFEYKANWANEVPERFLKLHGYSLLDHLAEMDGQGDPETVARIKADYRSTMETLHLEYIQAWVKWAHARGEMARNQAHGAPGNLLDLYAAADIAETELFGAQKYDIPGFRRDPGDVAPDPQTPLVHRLASSASHVVGHPLASSETFTWLREHFREAPSQMKPEVDQLFLTGINHIFYHGTAYSPQDATWPGWLFYASTEANSRNPLWTALADLNGYIARCQSLLQSGAPDNDILLYWPLDDLWHDGRGLTRGLSMHSSNWLAPTPAGQAASQLVQKGYAFDFISDRQLNETRVEKNSIITPGGAYRTLLIPPTVHISPATFERIIALAEQGATILFLGDPPADVPGYGSLEARRSQLKAAAARLHWSEANSDGVRTARPGAGQVYCAAHLPALLPLARVSREALADLGPGAIRRRMPDGYVYFIANLTGKPADGWVKLGRPAQSVDLLDPMTGRGTGAAFRLSGDRAEVFLQLRPGESCFLRTHDQPAPSLTPAACFVADGQPLPINGEWHVTFIRGGPDLPPPLTLTDLKSWADLPNEAAQRFAGAAQYQINFTLPPHPAPDAWRLDLGDVREAARVSINGVPLAHLWALPFDTIVSLKPGENTLTVEVTNTAANRIRDLDKRRVDWKNGKNFVNIHYQPFDASGWPLQPSGLIGPVRLIPLKSIHPETLDRRN